jgi:hypothetical protein
MKAMKFNSLEEKRRFTKTLINEGLQAAREQYLNENKSIVFPPGQTRIIFNEELTLKQAEEKYPNVDFIKVVRKIVKSREEL